jgi:hypothetical protein
MADVRSPESSGAGRKQSPSIPDLVSNLGRDVMGLFSKEANLFRAEIKEKFSILQAAGASLAAGAICLLAALLILLQALIVALTNAGMNPAWASLIVGGGVAIVGVILLQIGRYNLREDVLPTRTQAQVQRDAEMVKERVR